MATTTHKTTTTTAINMALLSSGPSSGDGARTFDRHILVSVHSQPFSVQLLDEFLWRKTWYNNGQ